MQEDDRATVDYGDDEMDKATVNYGSDPEMDVEDQEMRQNRKRDTETKDEKKKKPKVEPPPTDYKPIKKERTKQRVDAFPASNSSRGAAPATAVDEEDDPDVSVSGTNINRSTDMTFWEQQSAREIRTQLNLRFRKRVGDWAFKSRQQLIEIVRGMIADGTW